MIALVAFNAWKALGHRCIAGVGWHCSLRDQSLGGYTHGVVEFSCKILDHVLLKQ